MRRFGRIRSGTVGTLERIFLGWEKPLVETAAGYLSRRFASDLTGAWVVVPGGRFGRQLLARMAREHGSVLGDVLTIDGFLGARLVDPGSPVAGSWVRRLAWARAAKELDGSDREALWPRRVQESELQLLAMAETVDSVSRRLAGDGMTFAGVGAAVDRDRLPDVTRWGAMERLQCAYRGVLDELGLVDEAMQRVAATDAGRGDGKPIVLVGLVEIPGLLRRVLSWEGTRATALIAAPEACEQLFDAHGAVNPAAWQDRAVEIDESMLRVVEGPQEQATTALLAAGWPGWWGDGAGAMDASSVVIAVPDEEVRRGIERTAPSLEAPVDGREPVRVRSGAGTPVTRSGVGRLLRLVADFLADPEFVPYAALLRHRDVERFVRERGMASAAPIVTTETELLAVIDDYGTRYVHGVVDGRWLGERSAATAVMHGVLEAVFRGVTEMLGELWAGDRPAESRPISGWGAAIGHMVRRVMPEPVDERDLGAAGVVDRVCRLMRSGAVMGAHEPRVNPGAAIRLLLAEMGRESVPDVVDAGAIELLGWLEAVHDPAPTLILTGMNEGSAPRESAADAMVPEGLRRSLGLSTREVLLARDKCLLTQAIKGHTRVLIVAGRRSGDGSRLWPSRLLMASDDATVVRRLGMFLEKGKPGDRAALKVTPKLAGSRAVHPAFELMPVIETREITQIGVTSFKRYMQSPYGFYLDRVLRLREVEDEALEMEASVFGSLVHKVLDRFAKGPGRNSADAALVEAEVQRCLDEVAAEDAGDAPPTAVAVQILQAAHRLRGFARWQAARAGEGWEILHTEWTPSRKIMLDVEERGIELKGRIDRIDLHRGSGELALLDYKTGEGEKERIRSMYSEKRGELPWNDLQLPLYRVLAKDVIEQTRARSVRLGFITLPKDGETELALGDWGPEALDLGVETARRLAKQMIEGVWRLRGADPPSDGPGGALCGVSVIVPRTTAGVDGVSTEDVHEPGSAEMPGAPAEDWES